MNLVVPFPFLSASQCPVSTIRLIRSAVWSDSYRLQQLPMDSTRVTALVCCIQLLHHTSVPHSSARCHWAWACPFLTPPLCCRFSSTFLYLCLHLTRTIICSLDKYCPLVAKLCLTLCDPMDYSPPGSVHGILCARILEWVAISFSRVSSQPRDRTHVSCLTDWFFTTEPPGRPPG